MELHKHHCQFWLFHLCCLIVFAGVGEEMTWINADLCYPEHGYAEDKYKPGQFCQDDTVNFSCKT